MAWILNTKPENLNEARSKLQEVQNSISDEQQKILNNTQILNNKEDDSQDIKLAEMEKGDFFGLTSLIASKSANYLVDVVAKEPVELVKINRDDIFLFFSDNHRSSVKILLFFMKKLNEQLEDLTEMYTDIQLKGRDISQIMEE